MLPRHSIANTLMMLPPFRRYAAALLRFAADADCRSIHAAAALQLLLRCRRCYFSFSPPFAAD